MDEAYALVRPYIEEDPRAYVTVGNTDRSVEAMRTWIQTRSSKVQRWYE